MNLEKIGGIFMINQEEIMDKIKANVQKIVDEVKQLWGSHIFKIAAIATVILVLTIIF